MAYNPKIVKDVPASMGLTESTLYPLLIAFIAVAVTVYICIWVLALCAWIVAVAFGGAGAVLLAFAASGIAIGHVPYVIATLGAGLAFIGVGSLRALAHGPSPNRSCVSRRSGHRRPSPPSGKTRAKEATKAHPT